MAALATVVGRKDATTAGGRPTKAKIGKLLLFGSPINITHIKYQNLTINLDDILFRYGKDQGKIELELNIRDFSESPEWTAATFILLDNVLGEYHTEMSLSYIDKKKLNEQEITTLFPIKNITPNYSRLPF